MGGAVFPEFGWPEPANYSGYRDRAAYPTQGELDSMNARFAAAPLVEYEPTNNETLRYDLNTQGNDLTGTYVDPAYVAATQSFTDSGIADYRPSRMIGGESSVNPLAYGPMRSRGELGDWTREY